MGYATGSMFGSLVFGAIFGFFAYCIVQGKTKSTKKGLIAFILVMLIVAIIKCFVIGNIQLFDKDVASSSTGIPTEEEQEEPVYCKFGDIKIRLNCDSNSYEKIDDYTELSFEYTNENGKKVDASNKRKKEIWESHQYGEPYKTKLFQSFSSSDMLTMNRLSKDNCAYDNIDSFMNDFIDSDENICDKKDFNIEDVHACAIYYDYPDDGMDKAMQAEVIFFYKDNFYLADITPVLGDLDTNIKEFKNTVILD